MTAIYAFTCPEIRLAAVAADDIEFNSGARVDKVMMTFDRYAVALHGSDLMTHAIGAVGRFHQVEGHTPPASIEDFAANLARAGVEVARLLYPKYVEAHRCGQIPEENWQVVHQNRACVVVLDCHSLRLCNLDFGLPFPPERLRLVPDVEELEHKVLHRFGLASGLVTGPQPLDIPVERDLTQYFAGLLAADHERERALGSLGASIVVDGERRVERSCLADPPEYVRESFGQGLLGFRIVVVNPQGPATAEK